MVDIDDLDKQKNKKEGGSSSSSSSKSSGGGSSKSSGGSGSTSAGSSSGTFSMDDDEVVDTEGKSVSDVSKEWASGKSEMNYGSHEGEGINDYIKRQVKEVEELHENIHEMAMNNKENFDEFTLFMHALFLNFGRNRVGIMDTIQNNFGKSREEAFQLTNKICERADEKEFMSRMVRDMTKDLADM